MERRGLGFEWIANRRPGIEQLVSRMKEANEEYDEGMRNMRFRLENCVEGEGVERDAVQNALLEHIEHGGVEELA